MFSRQGAHFVVLDRNETAAHTTAEAIRAAGGHAIAMRCDVRVDILVNNAGIAHVGTIEQTSPEDLDRLYAVNVRGVHLCSRAAVAIMLRFFTGQAYPIDGGVLVA